MASKALIGSAIIMGGGGGKKNLWGEVEKVKMCMKHAKSCHFYPEIVIFGLILTHLK